LTDVAAKSVVKPLHAVEHVDDTQAPDVAAIDSR
jgi:hypothetical protein